MNFIINHLNYEKISEKLLKMCDIKRTDLCFVNYTQSCIFTPATSADINLTFDIFTNQTLLLNFLPHPQGSSVSSL